MSPKKAGIIAGIAVAGIATAGLVGANTASADPTAAPSSNPTASANERPGRGGERSGKAPGTVVTGDEAQKVLDAVKAKFPDATLTTVTKHDDGTYGVRGTNADGTKVGYRVSADLATITERTPKKR